MAGLRSATRMFWAGWRFSSVWDCNMTTDAGAEGRSWVSCAAFFQICSRGKTPAVLSRYDRAAGVDRERSRRARKARLLEQVEITPGVRNFVFEVPEVEQLYFIPGQFVSFTENIKGKQITRPYSIASPPDGNRFEICLNRVEEGLFSPYLFDLKPGASVEMSAPLGYFVLRDPGRDCIFVATGTGIAPFRSMLHAWLAQHDKKQFTLIFGVRYERGLMYRNEFEDLARKHANLRFCPTLSRPEPTWRGR